MALPTARDFKTMSAWAVSRLPKAPFDGKKVDSAYPEIIRDVTKRLKLQSKIEDNSYRQGFASYIDAWFYQDRPAFRLPPYAEGVHDFHGLYVLFCRFAPYYVMGQGAKSWSDRAGSSYMLAFSGVDVFQTQAVKDLSGRMDPHLSKYGLLRLHKAQLAEQLPPEFHFDTNLVDEKHRLYDALFFWYD